MKKIAILATAAIGMLASCTTNDFVGDENLREANERGNGAIVFGTGVKAPTREDKTGKDAAGLLKNKFVVEGFKWNGTEEATDNKETVFDHYNVKYVENSAYSTTSNTAGWEYVGQEKHANATIEAQSIKYWDYAKKQYDFIAYSAGNATEKQSGTISDGEVLISKIDPNKLNGEDSNSDGKIDGGAYTIEGKADDLAKVYIADMVTVYRDGADANDAQGNYKNVVQFKFRSLAAKVRIALYETVPGYSVKDVVFYTNASTAATDGKAHLYTTDADVFNSEGKYIVYFPTTGSAEKDETDYNKAHLAFVPATGTSGTTTTKTFGELDYTNKGADKEVAEAAGKMYLGRFSSEATFAGENTTSNPNYYTVVIPNESGAVLNLKVNYTLVSTDGSGETINVTGATAKVPAVYAQWKSGYAYTYLFKISQNSNNGVTNPSAGPAGLYPITFDAVVTETEDGVQETITTVAEPSITTYAKGQVVTTNNEYTTGSNIYVVVENAPALNVGTNAKLYTVTLETGAAQTINEASVANALDKGTENPTGTWTVTDANGTKMIVTAAAGLTAVTEIAAADSPTGTAITVNGAKFTPSAEGTYVFEYIDGTNKYYKIIKVASGS